MTVEQKLVDLQQQLNQLKSEVMNNRIEETGKIIVTDLGEAREFSIEEEESEFAIPNKRIYTITGLELGVIIEKVINATLDSVMETAKQTNYDESCATITLGYDGRTIEVEMDGDQIANDIESEIDLDREEIEATVAEYLEQVKKMDFCTYIPSDRK